jgi:hypothetical protein
MEYAVLKLNPCRFGRDFFKNFTQIEKIFIKPIEIFKYMTQNNAKAPF